MTSPHRAVLAVVGCLTAQVRSVSLRPASVRSRRHRRHRRARAGGVAVDEFAVVFAQPARASMAREIEEVDGAGRGVPRRRTSTATSTRWSRPPAVRGPRHWRCTTRCREPARVPFADWTRAARRQAGAAPSGEPRPMTRRAGAAGGHRGVAHRRRRHAPARTISRSCRCPHEATPAVGRDGHPSRRRERGQPLALRIADRTRTRARPPAVFGDRGDELLSWRRLQRL